MRAFGALAMSINQQRIVLDRLRGSCVAGIAGQVLAVCKQDEGIDVRMNMAILEMPVRILGDQLRRLMAFGRATLERHRGCFRAPVAAPEDDVGVLESMPRL